VRDVELPPAHPDGRPMAPAAIIGLALTAASLAACGGDWEAVGY
jgi:hypothetical protein